MSLKKGDLVMMGSYGHTVHHKTFLTINIPTGSFGIVDHLYKDELSKHAQEPNLWCIIFGTYIVYAFESHLIKL